jgi:hypothetical protein
MTEKDQEALKEWWRSRGAIPATDEEHPLGTRTSDTAIRKDDGTVEMKDDPGLTEKVAALFFEDENMYYFKDARPDDRALYLTTAKSAIADVLREAKKWLLNEQTFIDDLARENGIEL